MTMDERSVPHEALRRQAKDWVVHLSTGEVTEADLRALERWRAESPLHAQAYLQACRLWNMLEAPLETLARAADPLASVRASGIRRSIGRRELLGGALAASAAAALGIAMVRPPLELWPALDEWTADYRTGIGEQRKIELADRGSVELNTRTSLNIRERTELSDTIELVAGEAAISAGARVVVVRAAAGEVSATNAQFTVRCDGADVRIACLRGAIDADYASRRTILQPGEQIVFAAQKLGPVAAVNPDIVAAWRHGLLVFEDERLARVIEEVNRYRAGRIILMNAALGERRVSARFKLDRLDAVLTQFEQVFGARATPIGGGFVVLT
jgi:transmembrane sensor